MFDFRSKKKTSVLLLILCFTFLSFSSKDPAIYAQNQPVWQKSIRGEISAEPRFENLSEQEEVLILPSSSGLYILKEGQIDRHLYPGKEILSFVVIPDQDSDGTRDLIIGIEDELLPNVLCLSSRTGEIIWWFCPESRIFKEGFGWFNYQPEINAIIYPSEGLQQSVYLTAGDTLYKISISNGEVIWKQAELSKIVSYSAISDINDDKINELCFSNQLGEIILLDGQTGKEIWRNKPGFLSNHRVEPGEIKIFSYGHNILVTDNTGDIAVLDPIKGDRIWQTKGTKSKDNETGEFAKEYCGDVDGDGEDDIVLSIKGINQRIICLNGKNGDLEWEYEFGGSVQGNASMVEWGGKEVLFVLDQVNPKVQHFAFLDLSNGQELKEEIVPVDYLGHTSSRESYLLGDSQGRILLTGSRTEIMLLDKDITRKIWSLPRFSDAGFLKFDDKNNHEYLLLFTGNPENQGEKKIGLIQKTSDQRELIWEYLLDAPSLADYKGIEKIQISGDLDQDGVNDILGVLAAEEPVQNNLPSKILALNGISGKVLWEGNLILDDKVNSLIQYQDVNSDGSPEVLVGTSSHFYILDGASGKILKNWPHYNLKQEIYFEPTKGIAQEVILIPAGDVNKDGMLDLFIVSPREVRLGLTNRVGSIDFYFKELFTLSQGEIDLNQVDRFDDINNDDIAELQFTRSIGNKKTVQTIISGSDGGLLIQAEGINLVLKATGVDFNSNGSLDIISYQDIGDQEKKFQVIDGTTGDGLWAYQGLSGVELFPREYHDIPSCVVEDFNSDGIPELGLIKNSGSGTGLKIEIFDVAGGWEQPYKTLNIQALAEGRFNRYGAWAAGFSLQKMVQGAKPYLAVAGRLGGRDEGSKLILYNYLEEKTVALYPILGRKLNLSTDSLIVEDIEGKVSFLDFTDGNPTVKVENAGTALSPLKVKWQNQEPFVRTRIYIDNVLALETTAEAAELEITQGEHLIGVAQYSLSGTHSFQNIPVRVSGDSNIRVITILLAIAFLGLVFGVPYYFKGRIKAGVENG